MQSITGVLFGFLLLGGICNNVISDLLWAKSIVLTSPTVATVGLSITIPLAMLSDYIIFADVPSSLAFTGASLVIVGFFFVIYHPKEGAEPTAALEDINSVSAADFESCPISSSATEETIA